MVCCVALSLPHGMSMRPACCVALFELAERLPRASRVTWCVTPLFFPVVHSKVHCFPRNANTIEMHRIILVHISRQDENDTVPRTETVRTEKKSYGNDTKVSVIIETSVSAMGTTSVCALMTGQGYGAACDPTGIGKRDERIASVACCGV